MDATDAATAAVVPKAATAVGYCTISESFILQAHLWSNCVRSHLSHPSLLASRHASQSMQWHELNLPHAPNFGPQIVGEKPGATASSPHVTRHAYPHNPPTSPDTHPGNRSLLCPISGWQLQRCVVSFGDDVSKVVTADKHGRMLRESERQHVIQPP